MYCVGREMERRADRVMRAEAKDGRTDGYEAKRADGYYEERICRFVEGWMYDGADMRKIGKAGRIGSSEDWTMDMRS